MDVDDDAEADDDIEPHGGPQGRGFPADKPAVELAQQDVALSQPPMAVWGSTLLSDDTMAALVSDEYDPFWIRNNGLDPSILEEWTRRQTSRQNIKFFFSVVFKISDIFRLPVLLEGTLVEKDATVSD